jgi:hypothetical protein
MDYRVTVGLGQDSVEEVHLVTRAAALVEQVRLREGGRDATVDVDPVKAALQVVVVLAAPDALTASRTALDLLQQSLQDAQMPAPGSILTVEAESVPDPVSSDDVRRHSVSS